MNLAIRGIVRPGDHVVTTVCDHNSVLRPLRSLHETAGVAVTYVPCDAQGFISPDDVRDAMRLNTRLVAVVHASNVTGAIQSVAEIAKLVRESDAYFLQQLTGIPSIVWGVAWSIVALIACWFALKRMLSRA